MLLHAELATLHALHDTACKFVVAEKLSAVLYAVDAHVGVVPLAVYLIGLALVNVTDCVLQKLWLVGVKVGVVGAAATV